MAQPTSISRRIASCIEHHSSRDYEGALIEFFPALDKTAKKRRNVGVGQRIRAFINDQESVITAIATGNILGITVNDMTLANAIYTFGRTPIAHEGELDPRLTFNDDGVLSIGSIWNLPSSYIFALYVSVMIAPENRNEAIPPLGTVRIFGNELPVNSLWGAQALVEGIIADAFGDPGLFERV